MRKRKYITTLAAMLTIGLMATSSFATIIGSAHDFSGESWSDQQICKPCHTPHNSIQKDSAGNLIVAPLWNHTLSTATYTLYLDATGAGVTGAVDSYSLLCLSCHDGTVNLDAFGGAAGTVKMDADMQVGTDLSNDHPIGDPTKGMYNADGTSTKPYFKALDLTVSNKLVLRTAADGTPVVSCTTCHEPHNRGNVTSLLRVAVKGPATTVDVGHTAVNGSALCLSCHNK